MTVNLHPLLRQVYIWFGSTSCCCRNVFWVFFLEGGNTWFYLVCSAVFQIPPLSLDIGNTKICYLLPHAFQLGLSHSAVESSESLGSPWSHSGDSSRAYKSMQIHNLIHLHPLSTTAESRAVGRRKTIPVPHKVPH